MARSVMLNRMCWWIGLLCVLNSLSSVESQSCTTPRNSEGNCVPLRECTSLLRALRSELTTELQRYARASNCGYDGSQPKVCCDGDECTTPNSRAGACIPITECPELSRFIRRGTTLTTSQRQYLAQSQCGFSGGVPNVCCGFVGSPQTTSGGGTTATRPVTTSTSTTTTSTGVANEGDLIRNRFLPRTDQCGLQTDEEDRIWGGNSTAIDEYPWMVALEYNVDDQVLLLCGGALISDRYVVTAAHCATNTQYPLIGVRLGEWDVRNDTDCSTFLGGQICAPEPQRIGYTNIIVHENFDSANLYNDIALIRLERRAQLSAFVQPICLPHSNVPLQEGERLHVTGWGTSENEMFTSVKLKVSLRLANQQVCRTTLKNSNSNINVDSQVQLCIGGDERKSACPADSGGPLMKPVARNGRVVWYLVGLVSYGPSRLCGRVGLPGIYTRVHTMVPWILRNLS